MAKSSRAAHKTVGPGVRFLLWFVVGIVAAGAVWLGCRSLWASVVRRPEFQVDPLALDLSGCPDWVNAPPGCWR
ncbi:MAG: hypothetical protein ACYS1C_03920 [Planctomycetota bacterium]|jgi:hypothetical protein